MESSKIKELAQDQQDYVVAMRREFHRSPELSGKEFHTRERLIEEIEKMGVPYEKLPGTGLIAIIEGGKPGKNKILRADIDALPLQEETENLKQPKVCVSEIPGRCHACGHDAHMAMLLGTMRILVQNKEELPGTVYCCFEEGEETNCGIDTMIEALEKYPIDECFAFHVYNELDAGKVNIVPGPRMAGTVGIGFHLKGKSGHGSRPDMSVNPVFCAASILTNTATAWVNQITAGRTVTLGVTSIQGGEAPNVIPDTADILGSLRFFNDEEGEKAVRIFKNVAEHTAAMNNCQVQFDDRFCVLCAPVINDEYYSNLISTALPEVLPENVTVSSCEPWYASESFSCYRRICPSVLAHLGINNPSYGSGAAHHNGFFDVDEGVLSTGVISTLKFVAMLQK